MGPKFGTRFWINPAPKDDLNVLDVVTHYTGTLEEVHLVKYNKKNLIFLCFFFFLPNVPLLSIIYNVSLITINLIDLVSTWIT